MLFCPQNVLPNDAVELRNEIDADAPPPPPHTFRYLQLYNNIENRWGTTTSVFIQN